MPLSGAARRRTDRPASKRGTREHVGASVASAGLPVERPPNPRFGERALETFLSEESDSSVLSDVGCGSSLASWEEDDFDREAARQITQQFKDIDEALYDGRRLDDAELDSECGDWRAKFPHFRVVARQLLPSRDSGYRLYPHNVEAILASTATNSRHVARNVNVPKSDDGLAVRGTAITLHRPLLPHSEEILLSQGVYEEVIACHDDESDGAFDGSTSELRIQVLSALLDKLLPRIDNLALEPASLDQQTSARSAVLPRIPQKRNSDPQVRPRARFWLPADGAAAVAAVEAAVLTPPRSRRVNSVGVGQPSRQRRAADNRMVISAANARLRPLGGNDKVQSTTRQKSDLTKWTRLPAIGDGGGGEPRRSAKRSQRRLRRSKSDLSDANVKEVENDSASSRRQPSGQSRLTKKAPRSSSPRKQPSSGRGGTVAARHLSKSASPVRKHRPHAVKKPPVPFRP